MAPSGVIAPELRAHQVAPPGMPRTIQDEPRPLVFFCAFRSRASFGFSMETLRRHVSRLLRQRQVLGLRLVVQAGSFGICTITVVLVG